jgi:hypothetical protein
LGSNLGSAGRPVEKQDWLVPASRIAQGGLVKFKIKMVLDKKV